VNNIEILNVKPSGPKN